MLGSSMPRKDAKSSKREALRRQGCLHPRPEQVGDPLFQQSEFFDAHDLVQVKYEMLRRVQIEQQSVSQTGAAESAQADGRSAQLCATDPSRAALVGHAPTGYRNSRKVWHYRSSSQHRARSGAAGKKTTLKQPPAPSNGATLVAAYEDLRRQALEGIRSEGLGLALLLGQGMAAWMKACSATLPIPSQERSVPTAPVIWASELYTEAIRILASMALGQTSSRSL